MEYPHHILNIMYYISFTFNTNLNILILNSLKRLDFLNLFLNYSGLFMVIHMVYSQAKLSKRSILYCISLILAVLFGLTLAYLICYMSINYFSRSFPEFINAVPSYPASITSIIIFIEVSKKLCSEIFIQTTLIFISAYTMFGRIISYALNIVRGIVLGFTLCIFTSPCKWWAAYAAVSIIFILFSYVSDIISRKIGFQSKTNRIPLISFHIISALFSIGLCILVQFIIIYLF